MVSTCKIWDLLEWYIVFMCNRLSINPRTQLALLWKATSLPTQALRSCGAVMLMMPAWSLRMQQQPTLVLSSFWAIATQGLYSTVRSTNSDLMRKTPFHFKVWKNLGWSSRPFKRIAVRFQSFHTLSKYAEGRLTTRLLCWTGWSCCTCTMFREYFWCQPYHV